MSMELDHATTSLTNRVSKDYYEIIAKGHVSDCWSASFAGMSISRLPSGGTMLAGSVVDQPQLHGILSKVRDMGLTLVSVRQTAEG